MAIIDQDLVTRSLTGIVFLLIMIFGITYSPLSLLILFGLITTVGSWEFSKLIGARHRFLYAMLNLGAYTILSPMLEVGYFTIMWSLIGLMILYAVLPSPSMEIRKRTSLRALGSVLLIFPFALLQDASLAGPERIGILFFFILLWTNDSMAYVSGRLLGKTKLWPRVSPKKTWEGFFGGILSAIALAYFIHPLFKMELHMALLMAMLVGVFGTLGDLLESSLKRKAGVKDSGSFMPGHGGILDRFDGVMLSAPMVYMAFQIFS